ncbi:MAG: HlyD family efflux transporter periplasmic adaptor subunit [Cyanobacteria bacterium P01_A01_bin.123]
MERSSDISRSWFFLGHCRWFISFGFACVLLVGGIVYISRNQPEELPADSLIPIPVPTTVNALGRLEPADGIIQVSASSNQAVADRVAELRVSEGDQVQAGQVIAVLDSRDRLQAALAEADQQVKLAEARAQVQSSSGAEEIVARRAVVTRLEAQLAGEVQSQQAVIARLEAEVQNVRVDVQRSRLLFVEGAISEDQLDTQLLALETAQEELNEQTARTNQSVQTLEAQIREAQAILDQTIAVQPNDVAVVRAEVEQAKANVNRLQAELETAFIRAPIDAQVLEVQTRAGETISDEGIVELGDTAQMVIVAEVFESDINQVRQGQRAVASSPTGVFAETLTGSVEDVGLKVATRDVLDTTPTAATDARIIEVRIRLDERSTRIAAGLTNLQVNVEIEK